MGTQWLVEWHGERSNACSMESRGTCTFQVNDLDSDSVHIQSLPLTSCVTLDKSSMNLIFLIYKKETLMYFLYNDAFFL